ncbi:DUF899 family protein [Rhodococcus sp. DK17]|uniref:DUF899 family protein n=1 Tax=unclassified Rhodococcus (in: high G+C Gram-positive bacteria) TaxID=192944 RepID=UPI0002E19239
MLGPTARRVLPLFLTAVRGHVEQPVRRSHRFQTDAASTDWPQIAILDPATGLVGPHGPVPLLDVFEGRSQLIAYFHMWHAGHHAAEQCEGCTFFNGTPEPGDICDRTTGCSRRSARRTWTMTDLMELFRHWHAGRS